MLQGAALAAATQRAVAEGSISSQEGAARLMAFLCQREAEVERACSRSLPAAVISSAEPGSFSDEQVDRAYPSHMHSNMSGGGAGMAPVQELWVGGSRLGASVSSSAARMAPVESWGPVLPGADPWDHRQNGFV